MFSTSDRHRKITQLRWQNMSSHLTNETSYWLKKRLMHLNWAIYNVSDLNIDPHVCFFPTLSLDRAQPIPLAQPEACPQRSKRPVCARTLHRSRNGYPGWSYMEYKASKHRWKYPKFGFMSKIISDDMQISVRLALQYVCLTIEIEQMAFAPYVLVLKYWLKFMNDSKKGPWWPVEFDSRRIKYHFSHTRVTFTFAIMHYAVDCDVIHKSYI